MTGQNSKLPILGAKIEAQVFPNPGPEQNSSNLLVLKGAERLERAIFVDTGKGLYSTQIRPLMAGRYLIALVDSTFGGENAVTAHRIDVGQAGGRSSGLLPKTKTPINYLWYALGGLGSIVVVGSSLAFWFVKRSNSARA